MVEEKVENKEKEEKIEEITVDYTKHYKKYYENLAGERLKEVAKLAKDNDFTIDIYNEETGEWKPEQFKYREIPTKKWMELEVLRSQYTDMEKVAASKLLSSKDMDKYDFSQKLNTLLSQLYEKSAFYFLGMDAVTFGNSKWIQVKSIIDACNHRTIFTLPN